VKSLANEQSIESAKDNARQDAMIEALDARVAKNEQLIDKLAEGQLALTQSMTEVHTTLNMLLNLGKPALVVLVGILGALGIDITGVM
jgi:uncharacterized coiled-coil protein SlyX